jgi:hypothetical protein
MSARKLSRLAGLVFVLAAIVSGVGAASSAAQHGNGAAAISTASQTTSVDIIWT